MRKLLTLLLTVCLLAGTWASGNASAQEPEISSQEMTMYVADVETTIPISIYHIGDSDVPYVSLEDWAEIMTDIKGPDDSDDSDASDAKDDAKDDAAAATETAGEEDYALTYSTEGNTGKLTRESGFWAAFDCDADTITFLDYDAFVRSTGKRVLIDILSVDDPLSPEDVQLYARGEGSYERYGDMLTLDLAAYGIDLVSDGDNCYVPIQTLSDFMLALNYLNIYYNGREFYLVPYGGLGSADEGFTPLGEKFYSVQQTEWSQAMADFNYAELCLAMDHLYGLKDIHHIDSFDALLYQLGLREMMKSTSAADQDEALYTLIQLHLDDLHSGFKTIQAMNDPEALTDLSDRIGSGPSDRAFTGEYLRYLIARVVSRQEGIPAYEEIGDTAYITFDHFVGVPQGVDYYETAPTEEAEDTVGIMLYAYKQIMRENSPVKNVVIDLSCNTGGAADAAVFVISAVLGDGSVSALNPMTGAMATAVYNVDLNLDHQYGQEDQGLTTKNVYCLTSPVSFSCGNLVPCVFKNSNQVTIIGRTSGGGSCVVLPMSTACGSGFQISGFTRLAFTKNGSFYDIDQGAVPDFTISKYMSFYDRERLTEYIDGLM